MNIGYGPGRQGHDDSVMNSSSVTLHYATKQLDLLSVSSLIFFIAIKQPTIILHRHKKLKNQCLVKQKARQI